MKICMVTRHCCIRVVKQALPLISMGHEVHLITNKITQYSDQFKTVTAYQDVDQLYDSIDLHRRCDIFHAHNEPSWFVTVAKEVAPHVPVVLDLHDSFLLRRPVEEKPDPERYRVSVDERNNVQLADGIVHCCSAMKKIIDDEFKPKAPSVVIPSALPKRFNRIDFGQWIGGLVYEGRIDIEDELGPKWDFFQYANYKKLALKAREIGMDFHIYTPRSNEKVRGEYEDISYLHQPLKLDKLIKQLGSHDWGLVGNIDYHEEWKHALPNKLFEYMAACVPIVSINASACSNFILDHGIGIQVDSLEELASRWKEHRECRSRLIKMRALFAMERYIENLLELYYRVLNRGKNG